MEDAAMGAQDLRRRYESGEPGALDAIVREAAKYHFYHRVEIVPGLATHGLPAQGYTWADELMTRMVSAMETIDFKGRRVLDIGCRDGALCFAAERLGAAEIIGIDNDLSPGLTDFLIPIRGSRVRAIERNVNDITRVELGDFDVVIFAGVLYHLRYPMWALRRIADVLRPGGTLLIEGGFIDGFADLPVLFCPSAEGSPYDETSVTFFNEAGLTTTLLSLGFSDVRWLGSFLYTSRLYMLRLLARHSPHFAWRYWWHAPRVCRKIALCVKGRQPEKVRQYWDGSHRVHTGK